MTAVIPDLLFHGKGSWREAASAAVGLRPSRSGFRLAEPQKAVKRSSHRTGGNLQLFGVEPAALGLSASPTRIRSAQETMRKKASRPLGGSPAVFFGVTLSAQSDFLSSYGLHETATTLDIPSRWDPRTKQQPTGLIAYPAAQGRAVSGCGSQRMLHALERRSHSADHGPSFASLFPPLAAVSSAAIPVWVKLKIP